MNKPKVKAPSYELISFTSKVLKNYSLHSICEESVCPNRAECFARDTATFLIMGKRCTRDCKFCAVESAKPDKLNPNEPKNIAKALKELNLKYVVITSVDRDDLKDCGAGFFAKTVQEIKSYNSDIKIELLTPDFKAKEEFLDIVIASKPYKLAHNIETVKRLSKKIMPQCSYEKSLKVLKYYSKSTILTKSSLMVGLGESKKEIFETFEDLLNAGVKQLTIGQYLSPSINHCPVYKYYTDEEFCKLKEKALNMGFSAVQSGILVRSSYYADKL